ncbi:PTS sugar transporter subunit IIC [Thermoanaerobacter pentosaceus]|uniref:Permease IIC component n=1 Tax=Thermoanaerobacter pentosaceus TaxID=694059 RepID=A0ABT9M4R3_9THEO|nr:PTS transporter subunit EIIC [Thermoanaerobacter pentosaceus]MDP9751121.1 PTS system cellobiose-specific IIC component [Thermoanaerobacter pentosaceus]
MEKIMDTLKKVLMPIANAFSRNRVIQGISNGFTSLLPILLVGSIFSLFSGMDIGGYQAFIHKNGLYDIFMVVVNMTNNIFAIYVVFAIAYQLAKILDENSNSMAVGILALINFMIVTPLVSLKGANGAVTTYVDMTYLGSSGIFVAIIIAIMTAYIYTIFIKKNITIKLPAEVPEMIEKSFSAIIPYVVVIVLSLIIYVIFHATSYKSIHGFIYGILGTPLKALQGSVFTWIILSLVASLLWFFGIHGGMVVIPIMMVLFMQPTMENVAAYAAGKPLPHIITLGFLNIMLLGGIGATLGLVILMTFFAKSAYFKALGKLALIPGIFGINEPIMFGMPIVLNPIMFIPFVLVPVIDTLIVYLSMYSGLVSYPRMAMLSTGTPVFLDAFLQVGVKGIILEIVLILTNMAIYFPFFKLEDNRHYGEEHSSAVDVK